ICRPSQKASREEESRCMVPVRHCFVPVRFVSGEAFIRVLSFAPGLLERLGYPPILRRRDMYSIDVREGRSADARPSPVVPCQNHEFSLEGLLNTLIDMDVEYDRESERLRKVSGAFNARALERLRMQHRERRQPYIQQLAILQMRTESSGA
ncbi:MAG: hypothetical protein ABW003_05090, partial [Microvirga sp.]